MRDASQTNMLANIITGHKNVHFTWGFSMWTLHDVMFNKTISQFHHYMMSTSPLQYVKFTITRFSATFEKDFSTWNVTTAMICHISYAKQIYLLLNNFLIICDELDFYIPVNSQPNMFYPGWGMLSIHYYHSTSFSQITCHPKWLTISWPSGN